MPNKATLAIREAAWLLVEEPAYLAGLRWGPIAGKAPHMGTLLFHYAYGKPAERVNPPRMSRRKLDYSELTDEELDTLEALLVKAEPGEEGTRK